jgi:hypothetical protein
MRNPDSILTLRHRKPSRSPSALTLTAREAVIDRAPLGRPPLTGGKWGTSWLSLHRYEPTMSMFGEAKWSPAEVWHSAIGGSGTLSSLLSASMVIAVIDVGLAWALNRTMAGEHAPTLHPSPTWIEGERTDIGAEYDAALPGLNVRDWQAGLDIQFHRRYCKTHG